MGYKWNPSKSQRKAFAIRMQDPAERKAYYERKEAMAQKRKEGSKFDYESAGGRYLPTKFQYENALTLLLEDLTPAQKDACNQIIIGYVCNEKIHHDYIHIVKLTSILKT